MTDTTIGERKLIQAIIDRAIEDATMPRIECHNLRKVEAIRQEARRWLSSFVPAAYARLMERSLCPPSR